MFAWPWAGTGCVGAWLPRPALVAMGLVCCFSFLGPLVLQGISLNHDECSRRRFFVLAAIRTSGCPCSAGGGLRAVLVWSLVHAPTDGGAFRCRAGWAPHVPFTVRWCTAGPPSSSCFLAAERITQAAETCGMALALCVVLGMASLIMVVDEVPAPMPFDWVGRLGVCHPAAAGKAALRGSGLFRGPCGCRSVPPRMHGGGPLALGYTQALSMNGLLDASSWKAACPAAGCYALGAAAFHLNMAKGCGFGILRCLDGCRAGGGSGW